MIPSRLLVVTDRHGSRRPLKDTVRAVLDGGARWVWFRDKDLEPGVRRDLALELLGIVHRVGGCLTVGADIELAAAIGADGVHLGGSVQAADVARARQVLGERALIGVSAHGLGDVRSASAFAVDYVTLSPIFATASKPGYGPSLGTDVLREAVSIGLPIVALGGIGADEARCCRKAGAAGIAVMGHLMGVDDPALETRCLLDAMQPAT